MCKRTGIALKLDNVMVTYGDYYGSLVGTNIVVYYLTVQINSMTRMVKDDAHRPFLCGCGKSYTRSQHLRRHQSTCTEPARSSSLRFERPEDIPPSPKRLYSCAQCDAGPFRKKKMVWAHVAMVHRERKHVCDQCSRAFPTKSKLVRHSTKHHGFTCPHCLPSSGVSHSSIDDLPLSCQRKFDNFISLRRHIASVHPKPVLTCTICGMRFSRPSALREHELTHTPGNPTVRRLFVCPLCTTPDGQSDTVVSSDQGVVTGVNPNAAAFTLKRNLHAHIRSVHINLVYPCTWPGCPVLLSTKQKLDEHMERHEKNRPLAHYTRPRHRRASAQDAHVNAKPIRRMKKAVAEEDIETASQSSIVALLMESSEEISAQ
ncbi:uncharacterized protein DEA37_0010336 [Paragonimus westermani]|uniref:C2H2-type domain-containing protein n=1 Tax=Paragonimus westermani TaxID=34504 RepID=A0A5J4NSJ3_9TREM|nr:uncharacterized protein DEA37_0010336 [Paragonimus westermani]